MDDAEDTFAAEDPMADGGIDSKAASDNSEQPEGGECCDEHAERSDYAVPVKSITFPIPSAESADYVADVADGIKDIANFASIIYEKNQQFLVIRDAVADVLGANGSLALATQSMKSITAGYASMTLAATEALRPALQNVRLLSLQMQEAMKSVSVVLDSMAIASKTFSEYWSNHQRITQTLTPIVEALREARLFYNFDELKDRYETWGEFGWVLFDEMPPNITKAKPESWMEANKLARTCIDDDLIEDLFENLRGVVAKGGDLDESIALYREGRYKPCAMMAVSLIECCLYKRSKRREGQSKRYAAEPLKRLEDQLPEVGYTVLSLLGTHKAFDYFFKFANDFDREKEGELNRNFLMHGMMYRKVTRVVCVKLFMLLLSVERLMRVA